MAIRLFTFPDPLFTIIRRFEPQVIEMITGPSPLAEVAFNATFNNGDQIQVQGNISAIGGGTTIFVGIGSATFTLNSAGAFNQTVTLTGPATRLTILGVANTTATFDSLTIDLL